MKLVNVTKSAFSFSINIFIIYFLLISPLYAKDNKIVSQSLNDSVVKNRIAEEKFILINGIEQWVTIKGDKSKPVILFLHGGPGSPMSPYSDNVYKEWEKDFIIVQWDQRGTARTFGRTAPPELTPEYLKLNPLTIEQMTADGIELSAYLIKHLSKKKIILFGTSWGSALGVRIVTKRPDLFYAYVGHSQIVNPSDDLPMFNKVYQMAVDRNDTASLKILNSIGKPPYDKAKNVGLLLRVVKKFEGANSTPAPENWFIPSAAYNNVKDEQNRNDGDDYSFVNYVGDSRFGVQSIREKINFMNDNVDFKIPIYIIQGEADLLTTKESTKDYFNKIKAPKKEYYLLPETAHGFNVPVVETQYKIFMSIKAS